ncbi:hypothetical protein L1987_31167 [Smallanthus sonchifolius]|uniref:Uncharacterized protein n=1 Tax=Smallanthus sonchifolius TaxID=185202 RepID=A0ACB9I475_9ASTR|nr:hypothetical protein L1987_31167 [Smallanthus sonchifolius]
MTPSCHLKLRLLFILRVTKPAKRRKKKSFVWEHFTIENVGEGVRRACCKRCKRSFPYITGSKVVGTSHLKRHVARGGCDVVLRKRRKKKSFVWEYFTIEKVCEGVRRACCKQCKRSFPYITGSKVVGTSHLKRHVARGGCEVVLRKRRKKKSFVWEYFTIENVCEGVRRACCKQCKRSFPCITGSKVVGTSHLKRHVARGGCAVVSQLGPPRDGSNDHTT